MSNNEMWQEVHDQLMSFSESILEIDGYKVTLKLHRINLFKNEVIVYVNGVIKDVWFGYLENNPHEPAKRFYPRHKAYKYKRGAQVKKLVGKKKYEEHKVYVKPTWTSFNKLKDHFIKNNKNIKIIS